MVPNAAALLGNSSMAQCLADQLPRLVTTCPAVGYPEGLAVVYGYPAQLVTALLLRLTGDLVLAADMTLATVVVMALVGARALAGLVTDRSWLAWGAAVAFLLSPVVLLQGGYGPLQLGFLLVPSYIALDIALLRRLEGAVVRRPGARGGVALALLALALVGVRTAALFLDGYSFVMALLLVTVVQVVWGVRVLGGRRTLVRGVDELAPARRVLVVGVAAAVALAALVVAYGAYSTYVDADVLQPMPLDFFRGQGVDLLARVRPAATTWWAELTGWYPRLTDSQAYSDGHNLHDVYVSWGLVLAALVGGAVWLRGRRRGRGSAPGRARPRIGWLLATVAVVGLVALALGTGPSLKVGDFRSAQEVTRGVPSFDQYLMAADQAGPATPWAHVYQSVPGVQTMRALYRWDLLVRLALVLLAAAGLHQVARRRPAVAVALGLLVLVDVLPTPANADSERAPRVVAGFEADAVAPLRGALQPQERVVLLNPTVGGSGDNAVAANAVCIQLRLRCVNAGGDKGSAQAADSVPASVAPLLVPVTTRTAPALPGQVVDALRSGELDAVVLVAYDLRANVYAWPPTPQQYAAGRTAAAALVAGRPLTVTDRGWSLVVRAASRPPAAGSG